MNCVRLAPEPKDPKMITQTYQDLAIALVCCLEAHWAEKENGYKASLGDDNVENPVVLAQEYRDARGVLEDALVKAEAAGDSGVLVMRACKALEVEYLPVVFHRIHNRLGFLTQEDTCRLEKSFPNHRVLVRTSQGRFLCPLRDLNNSIKELKDGDYLREVCIPASPKPVEWNRVGYHSP